MIVQVGSPRHGVHKVHYMPEGGSSIVCGGWKGGASHMWTYTKSEVTCMACKNWLVYGKTHPTWRDRRVT